MEETEAEKRAPATASVRFFLFAPTHHLHLRNLLNEPTNFFPALITGTFPRNQEPGTGTETLTSVSSVWVEVGSVSLSNETDTSVLVYCSAASCARTRSLTVGSYLLHFRLSYYIISQFPLTFEGL